MTESSAQIRPFEVEIAEAAIQDLKARIANTRWPEQLPGAEWEQAFPSPT
jgi:epoxide hydrolase